MMGKTLTYFDFNYVNDPPEDELVDYDKQLNENWTKLANKLDGFNNSPSNVIDPFIGAEAYHPEDRERVAVWDGNGWRRSINHVAIWSPWSNLEIRPPAIARPGYPPIVIVDTVGKRVRLSGGVIYGANSDPWPTNSNIEITTDIAVQAELAPAPGGMSVQQCATGQITTSNGFASAVVTIQRLTTPLRTAISVRYQGDAGGGNFIMLDGIEWWWT